MPWQEGWAEPAHVNVFDFKPGARRPLPRERTLVSRTLIMRLSTASMLFVVGIPTIAMADDGLTVAGAAPDAAAPAADRPSPTSAPSLSAICTDRPTKSNAACTVDEGHVQYETDIFNGTFSRQAGVTTATYLVTNPTLKYGLTKSTDVEINLLRPTRWSTLPTSLAIAPHLAASATFIFGLSTTSSTAPTANCQSPSFRM